jgi:hypothetical protein
MIADGRMRQRPTYLGPKLPVLDLDKLETLMFSRRPAGGVRVMRVHKRECRPGRPLDGIASQPASARAPISAGANRADQPNTWIADDGSYRSAA